MSRHWTTSQIAAFQAAAAAGVTVANFWHTIGSLWTDATATRARVDASYAYYRRRHAHAEAVALPADAPPPRAYTPDELAAIDRAAAAGVRFGEFWRSTGSAWGVPQYRLKSRYKHHVRRHRRAGAPAVPLFAPVRAAAPPAPAAPTSPPPPPANAAQGPAQTPPRPRRARGEGPRPAAPRAEAHGGEAQANAFVATRPENVGAQVPERAVTCDTCGHDFLSTAERARYCSPRCRARGYYQRSEQEARLIEAVAEGWRAAIAAKNAQLVARDDTIQQLRDQLPDPDGTERHLLARELDAAERKIVEALGPHRRATGSDVWTDLAHDVVDLRGALSRSEAQAQRQQHVVEGLRSQVDAAHARAERQGAELAALRQRARDAGVAVDD